MTAPDNNFDAWLDELIDKTIDWHGFYDEAITGIPEEARKFVDDTSWAGELHKAEKKRLVKAAITAKCQEREADSLLKKAVDMSGNEFAMGYDDSGCFWRFYAGARGAGSMMGKAIFHSKSPEPLEALTEYIATLTNKTAPTNQKAGEELTK
jgi:hypothetical protein